MIAARPILSDLERSTLDVTLEILAATVLLLLIAMTAFFYFRLPDSVPLDTPLMAIVIYVGITVVSQYPHRLNYLWAITEANARRQYVLARRMLSGLKLEVLVIFSSISYTTISGALGSPHELAGFVFAVLQIPILCFIVGLYMQRASREA